MRMRVGYVLMGLTWSLALGQDIGDYISKYTSVNGKGYMQPLADVFSADLNSGLFQAGRLSRVGFHVTIGVQGIVAPIGDEEKTFLAQTEEPFSPQQTAKVPTVFGKNEVVSVTGSGGTLYNFPGGFDMKMLPLVVPQVSLGSILGTEATVRYFMANVGEDIGDLTLTGIGVRHSLSQYLPLSPLDFSIGVFSQTFKVGDIVDAKTLYYGLQAGKAFGPLSIYGGAGYESADVSIEYEQDTGDQVTKISFDLKAKKQMRYTVGIGVKLAILKIHADVNLAAQKTFCAGFGFGW